MPFASRTEKTYFCQRSASLTLDHAFMWNPSVVRSVLCTSSSVSGPSDRQSCGTFTQRPPIVESYCGSQTSNQKTIFKSNSGQNELASQLKRKSTLATFATDLLLEKIPSMSTSERIPSRNRSSAAFATNRFPQKLRSLDTHESIPVMRRIDALNVQKLF